MNIGNDRHMADQNQTVEKIGPKCDLRVDLIVLIGRLMSICGEYSRNEVSVKINVSL